MSREQQLQEEIDLLRGILRVEPDDPRAGDTSHADLVLLRRIVDGTAAKPGPARRRIPVAARLAVAGTTVVALAAGALALQSGRDAAMATPPVLDFSALSVDEALAGEGAPARAALEDIARRAAAVPVQAGDGAQEVRSYAWYLTTTVDADGTTTVELAPTRQTTTIGPDGSFTNREQRGPALSVDGRTIDPDHFPVGGAQSTDRLPAGSVDPTYPASLPRDPEALRDAFVASQGGTDVCEASDRAEASCLYLGAVDLFTRWVVPSDLAAAVWATLADSPAVTDLGTTTDRLGREGHAVAVRVPAGATDQLQILVIDPTNGQLLSWEQVSAPMPALDLDTPVVSGFQVISSATWTEGAPPGS